MANATSLDCESHKFPPECSTGSMRRKQDELGGGDLAEKLTMALEAAMQDPDQQDKSTLMM